MPVEGVASLRFRAGAFGSYGIIQTLLFGFQASC